MEFALGVLHWTPDAFWNSTFYEISCAYIGHCRANGLGYWETKSDGWSDLMIEEHKLEEANLIARFGGKKKRKK
jgi:hypothetical protein